MILPGQGPAAFLRQARDELRQLHLAGEGGLELARRRADLVDLALVSLFRQVELQAADLGRQRGSGLAVVALGGYGRRELSPFSDIDLMVLYRPEHVSRVQQIAEGLFYPLWDAGLELGHGVRTVDECLAVAADNLELETSFCQARLLAGDQDLFGELVERLRTRLLADGGAAFAHRLLEARRLRHQTHGPAGMLIEPDLKHGRGGLRDVHEAFWLVFALRGVTGFYGLMSTGWLPPALLAEFEASTDILLRARASLHYVLGRKVDRLYLDVQDDVALVFRPEEISERGAPGGEVQSVMREPVMREPVMREIYEAAQAAALVSEDIWSAALAEIGSGAPEPGWVRLSGPPPDTLDARRGFLLSLLRAGEPGLPQLERLSRRGVLSKWLPGWEGIRSLGQRDGLHTYTVDGHSLRCVVCAVDLAEGRRTAVAGQPQVHSDHEPPAPSSAEPLAVSLARELSATPGWEGFLLACLLHDVGKAHPGEDHSRGGARLAARALAALGEPPEVREAVASLVRQHLLLPETAARRDLDDPELIARIAQEIGSRERLVMLYVLTVADSMSTGPAVWTPWAATLVRELFFKVLHVLDTAWSERRPEDVQNVVASDLEPLLSMVVPVGPHEGELTLQLHPGRLAGVDELSVVSAPLSGLLARLSGVLAYHGVNILSAQVQPLGDDLVARSFDVADQFGGTIPRERWEAVRLDIARAFEGRFSLDYRLAEKAARYVRSGSGERLEPPRVVLDDDASASLTVIEVHAADRIGLLYTLARTLDDLRLEVRLAKVATRRGRVVDVFYVADAWGNKLLEPDHLLEVERALLFALERVG
jgi:UTP:GlnB (protein PII) uridylyltransferase